MKERRTPSNCKLAQNLCVPTCGSSSSLLQQHMHEAGMMEHAKTEMDPSGAAPTGKFENFSRFQGGKHHRW